METHSTKLNVMPAGYLFPVTESIGIQRVLKMISKEVNSFEETHDDKTASIQKSLLKLAEYLAGFQVGKKSFLVFKNNKYSNIPTQNIAMFYIRYESPMIMCFDRQEYFVNYSLEQIQNLLPEKQFYRLNRQFLINFEAVKEVEHYFARKLLVNPTIPMKDKLIVSKEKVAGFLQWLDNR